MLNLLHIENIAVIEQAEISFDSGLNVLTGETGAGKSIVIDAISAILGERTHRDLIRTGCTKASVTAVFSGIPELLWFSERQIPYDPSELLIQRELHADGKNTCRVNGHPVTVSILHELGSNLINIHGQHDTQTLFDEQTHLKYLDLFGGDDAAKSEYESSYQRYRELHTQVQKLTMDEGEKIRRLETLRYQIGDIERANLTPGEDIDLESRRKILQNAERLSDGLNTALVSLSGNDNFEGAVSLLDCAYRELNKLCSVDNKFDNLAQTIYELRYTVHDSAEEVRAELDDLSYSEDELEQIENRLDVIHRLQKKYGTTVEDVLRFAEESRTELDEIELSDYKLEKLQKELSEARIYAEKCAIILRQIRIKSAELLRQKIESELAQLDMPNIRFQAEFEETELGENGMDFVRFLMSANVGEALKPMSKVASGGELARIMLAMKNVLAEKDSVPTLIFDEVDSGVSGRAAHKVATKLLSVALGKQVFCVTHLPQIAAMADAHLLISKETRTGRTFTSVQQLDKEGRIEELARIIGGSDITENTRKSAEDMLKK